MNGRFNVSRTWEKWVWMALFLVVTIFGVRTAILYMYESSISTTDTRNWDQRWNLVQAEPGKH